STANSNFYFVNDVVVSPFSSARIYAATRTGIWRSTDTGTTFSQVLAVGGYGCFDLEIRTDTSPTDQMIASCGNFGSGEIRRNTDAGGAGAWTQVLSSTTEPGMARTA